MTSLAASLHVAGLRVDELSLASQHSLGTDEARWVEGIASCASTLDNYWSTGATTRIAQQESDFKVPPRFGSLTPIGQGGMGIVYSALDHQTNERVAIKVGKSGAAAGGIKREFRTLARIRHPNLVVLKELHQFEESVFFSMEYIHGERFNSKSVLQKSQADSWLPHELAKLCDRLLQLIDGIDTLHRNRFVHCDIKPSNIIVTARGRVVLLDLGLARSSRLQAGIKNRAFGGTPAYMSPEQASGEPPQPASDWYSFGVVMFETLFGNRPFRGNPVDVLFDKLSGNAVAPSEGETGVAESLSKLCLRLLNPTSALRPSVEEIRQGLKHCSSVPSVAVRANFATNRFFGRQQELETLDRALKDSVSAADATILVVEGKSGIGKTHLIQRFLDQQQEAGDTVVFSGRCYENERIPYKAVDAVIEEIARYWHLQGQPAAVRADLIRAVGAVFTSFSADSGSSDEGRHPLHLQSAAEGLHAVLKTFVAQDKKIILFIDDVQWADADSGDLLIEMIQGIPLLLVCSQRPMEQPNQFVTQLNNVPAGSCSSIAGEQGVADRRVPVRRIKVSPFSDSEAEQFLYRNFPGMGASALGKALEASSGVPMFLNSLAQQIATMPTGQIESDELDWTKHLSPQEKRLMDFVCASGYPLPQGIAIEAAQISGECEASISALASSELITLSRSEDAVTLFPFHDMIRETIYSDLDEAERKTIHSSIATVSENKAGVSPDRLAFHFGEAGNSEKCCHYSIVSGDVAAESQAFAEAVRAYSSATQSFFGSEKEEQDLKQKLASAFGRLGRASDAGDLYFELASRGSGEASKFLQLAAEQYCVAGRLKEALQEFNKLLKPWGYTTFASETSVLWRLVWLRLKVGMSDTATGIRRWGSLVGRRVWGNWASDAVEPEDAKHVSNRNNDPAETIRITRVCDLLWDTAIAISVFDVVQAALFFSYSQQVAVSQNDEVRILRGTIMRAVSESVLGSRKKEQVKEVLDSTDTAATKQNAYLAGVHLMARALFEYSNGRWSEAIDRFAIAEKHLRANRIDSHRELVTVELWGLWALQFSGQVKAGVSRYQELLRSPDNQENLLNISNLKNFCGPFVSLAQDRPTEAFSSIAEAMKMWPVGKLCFQHVVAEYGKAEVYLYTRDYLAASEAVEKLFKTFGRSSYRIVEVMRVMMWELRGRCAASRFETVDDRAAQWIAKRSIKNLERETAVWARPMAQRVRACVELKKENFEAAEIALLAARDGFGQCNMQLFQYTAEAKICELTSQSDTARFRTVQAWFESQEIKNPQALIDLHFPGSL